MRKNKELKRNVEYVVEAFPNAKELSRKMLMGRLAEQMVPSEAKDTIMFAIKKGYLEQVETLLKTDRIYRLVE